MAKIENAFKKSLLRTVGTRWDVQSHEDKHSLGIPDLSFGVNGINGWIELKQATITSSNRVRPSKFTAPQINWLNRRARYGGNCYVMVKVIDEDSNRSAVFLFGATWAEDIAEGQTYDWYVLYSLWFWRQLDPDQFINIISGD